LGTDLSVFSQLDAIAARLNGRPRKTLGFATPDEVFSGLMEGRQRRHVTKCGGCSLRNLNPPSEKIQNGKVHSLLRMPSHSG
jgi:hypothetical protein